MHQINKRGIVYSSIIEIEVEMDSDFLAVEASSNAVSTSLYISSLHLPSIHINLIKWFFLQETIAEQIQQIMELENLEEVCSYLLKQFLF